jgi:hypothetical protein
MSSSAAYLVTSYRPAASRATDHRRQPKGFHRIRYYGLLAKSSCAENLARARQLLAVPKPQALPDDDGDPNEPTTIAQPCPCCGGRMIIIEAFAPGCQPRHRPSATTIAIRIDTS